MIKDTIGLHKAWKEKKESGPTKTLSALPLIDVKYNEQSVY